MQTRKYSIQSPGALTNANHSQAYNNNLDLAS